MANYSYDDFEKAANKAGLYNQFSQADLSTARENPDFGMSILGLKQDYANAATSEQRKQINDQANALRSSYGNYTGGADGSKFISTGLLNQKVDDQLNKVGNYGSFSYDTPAPTYNNQYASQQAALLNEILNRKEFEWSKENDPNWSAYKKEYLREGNRAAADTLAQTSAASGGRASSYAVNAATQAGDYYATQLSDKIPELYQQAYERYLAEQQMKYSDLNAVNSQEQLDYTKYQDALNQWNTDRNFAYTDYQNQYNMLQNQLANLQGQQQTEFNQNLTVKQYQDEIAQVQQEQKMAQINAILSAGGTPSAELVAGSGYSDEYIQAIAAEYAKQEAEAKQAALQTQIDAILSAGGSPSAELAASSGYSNEYIQALENYYKQQAVQAASSRSSGGSGGNVSASSDDSQTGDIYSRLLALGATDYGTAYAMLLNTGYSSTEAKELANYFNDTYYPGQVAGGGYKELKYKDLSDAAKKISDYIDSDLTTNYDQAIAMIRQLGDENEQNYLITQLSAYIR